MNKIILSKCGEFYYKNGHKFKTSNTRLCDIVHILSTVSGISLSQMADVLNLCPQQFSYKIHHKLNTKEIYKLSSLIGLNNDQIVNLFIKVDPWL